MGYPEMMQDIMAQVQIDENVKRMKELHGIDIVDYLTGFYNLAYFSMRLNEEMAKSRLCANQISIIVIDADETVIEEINTDIHEANKKIKSLSEAIRIYVRDIVAMPFRLENGKFALLMPDVDKSQAATIKQRINEMIKEEDIYGIGIKAKIEQYSSQEMTDDIVKSIMHDKLTLI